MVQDAEKRGWMESIKDLIRLLFFTRYSILFGSLLFGLAILPFAFSFPAVRAVYILDTPQRVFTMTGISILAAALTVQTFRVTICNAKGRFDDPGVYRFWDDPPEWLWKLRSISVWLIGLPLPICCMVITLQSQGTSETEISFLGLIWPWLPVMGGIVAATAILCLLDIINRWVLTPNLHDPRLFVLDHRFMFGRRQSPRQWQKNKDYPAAKACPLSPSRRKRWWLPIALMKVLRLTNGYLHELEVWVKSEDPSQPPKLESWEALLPGHVMMTLMGLFLLIAYGVSYSFVLVFGMLPDADGMYGTLFYLVGLIMIICGTLPALAFYFDRYRISPLLVVALFLVFVTVVFPKTAEHRFETSPPPRYISVSDPQSPWNDDPTFSQQPIGVRDVVDGWALRQQAIAKQHGLKTNRTFIVVTATGGGIQASAWTTKVLTGVHSTKLSLLKEDFPDSHEAKVAQQMTGAIGLISSVSGGSVGTLQYVAKYPELLQTERIDSQQDALGHVHGLASRSSLEAVAWGLFFPDAMRIVGINRSRTDDRGLVQEKLWASRMRIPKTDRNWHPVDTTLLPGVAVANDGTNVPSEMANGLAVYGRDDWRLGHLAHRVKVGTLPAVIFNSYIVNTGQRVMIAPFTFDDSGNEDRIWNTFEALEFAPVMGMEMRLAAAARLSATFPYVSPTAVSDRPLTKSERAHQAQEKTRSEIVLREGHYADGGFTDNEGLLGAIQFIERLRAEYDNEADRPFDQILLIRILPFPLTKPATDAKLAESTKLERDPTWKQSFIGPAIAMFNGRSVAQQERGAMDLEHLVLAEKRTGYRNTILKGQSQKAIAVQETKRTSTTVPIRFQFVDAGFRYTEGEDRSPPLSWKLSDDEKEDIDRAWDDWCNELLDDFSPETNLDFVYRLIESAAH